MTIKRIVNGQEMEFELTFQELTEAHDEKQHLIDLDDIDLIYEGRREYPEFPELTDDELDRAARLYRHYQNNSEDWVYDADEAIKHVISEREE